MSTIDTALVISSLRRIETLLSQNLDKLNTDIVEAQLEVSNARIARVEHRIVDIQRVLQQQNEVIMATQAQVDKLVADVAANKSLMESIKMTLAGYTKMWADQVQALKDALAAGGIADPKVDAAVTDLEATTASMTATRDEMAAAVKAGTEADTGGGTPPPAPPPAG